MRGLEPDCEIGSSGLFSSKHFESLLLILAYSDVLISSAFFPFLMTSFGFFIGEKCSFVGVFGFNCRISECVFWSCSGLGRLSTMLTFFVTGLGLWKSGLDCSHCGC